MIEQRVIEAINIVDIDDNLFKIKIFNDPDYSQESKDVVKRMHDKN